MHRPSTIALAVSLILIAAESRADEPQRPDAPSRPDMPLRVARVVNLLFNGFQAGWLAGTKLWVSPVRMDMSSGEDWVGLQRELNHTIGPVAPFMMGGTATVNLVPLLIDRDFRKPSWLLTAGGFLLNAAVIVTTLIVNVPVNDVTESADPQSPPENWRALRSRWETGHTVRSILSVTAFSLNLAALLVE